MELSIGSHDVEKNDRQDELYERYDGQMDVEYDREVDSFDDHLCFI